ncbi:hypothetical protein M5K25_002549 [Dendrobium thyrsiflorum]|uniref:Retrovirus-related Pol polyprotein from transposon TNT 1-94 n=1 Tax=Dendrobium thyrsiflorum TaxID=117978 RepID=A0ABD0VUW7_DENTH
MNKATSKQRANDEPKFKYTNACELKQYGLGPKDISVNIFHKCVNIYRMDINRMNIYEFIKGIEYFVYVASQQPSFLCEEIYMFTLLSEEAFEEDMNSFIHTRGSVPHIKHRQKLHLQVFKLFSTNGFEGYLIGRIAKPSPSTADSNPTDHRLWHLIDQNLVSVLLSTISPSILSYILNLSIAHEIWLTLEQCLQPTNCSRVIQLKNELHHIQLRDNTMTQYLAHIKALVDNIAATGAHIDSEDIILYILTGLPSTYNPFKIAIRTTQQPISLDVLYFLLCSEEINLQIELQKDSSQPLEHTALLSTRPSTARGQSFSEYPEAMELPSDQIQIV